MFRLLASIPNSIVARVVVVAVVAGGATLLLLVAILQTPLGGRLFNRAIADNSSGVAELVWLIENTPPDFEKYVLSAYNSNLRVARIDEDFGPLVKPDAIKRAIITSGNGNLVDNLRDREIRFRTIGAFEMGRLLRSDDPPPVTAFSLQLLAVELGDGRVLKIWLAPTISLALLPNAYLVICVLLVIPLIFLSSALWLVITRPIRQLERDAEQVGLAQTALPIVEGGPRELRRLSAALNRMRLRLARLIHEREQIVVAIAHDIATGLTRLRLRMDERPALNDPAIRDDLEQMEKLVVEMMAYARAEHPLVEPELIDLPELIDTIARASPTEVRVTGDTGFDFTMAGNVLALRRLFENLIENARRYGRGEIALRLSRSRHGVEVAVEDNGDGIPESELERVFEPFYRREASRNRATGGTGLGLGIARAIAQTHGATITLTNRAQGGLAARVFFPAALAT